MQPTSKMASSISFPSLIPSTTNTVQTSSHMYYSPISFTLLLKIRAIFVTWPVYSKYKVFQSLSTNKRIKSKDRFDLVPTCILNLLSHDISIHTLHRRPNNQFYLAILYYYFLLKCLSFLVDLQVRWPNHL